MTARVQEARATTASTPPVNNSLKPGQLYVELAAPVRLWVGVPTNLAASGQKMIYDQDQTATSINGKVAKGGDTMTGPLVLAADPTANLQAATKQYVDAVRTASVPIAGGTMTGLLLLSGDPAAAFGAATKQYVDGRDALRLPLTGGTLTGPLILAADPLVPLGAATRAYVDAKVAGATYPYLPLSGGHVTGSVQVDATLSVGVALPGTVAAGSLFSAQSTAGNVGTNIYSDGTNWRYRAAGTGGGIMTGNPASFGGLIFYSTPLAANAGDVAALSQTMIVNPGGVAVTGVLNVSSTLTVSGAANVTGALTANGGLFVNGSVSGGLGMYATSGAYWHAYTTGWAWQWNTSSGALNWIGNGAARFTIDPVGNVNTSGSLATGGGVYPDTTGNWALILSGVNRVHQYSPGWGWYWNVNDGHLHYETPGGTNWQFASSDWGAVNYVSYVAGNGAYVNISDERVKFDVAPADHGMGVVRAIRPITFHRVHGKTRKPHNREELGFSAQQLRDILPHAVVPLDAPDEWKDIARTDPLMGVTIEPIVAALVNAVTALHDRVAALETTP